MVSKTHQQKGGPLLASGWSKEKPATGVGGTQRTRAPQGDPTVLPTGKFLAESKYKISREEDRPSLAWPWSSLMSASTYAKGEKPEQAVSTSVGPCSLTTPPTLQDGGSEPMNPATTHKQRERKPSSPKHRGNRRPSAALRRPCLHEARSSTTLGGV